MPARKLLPGMSLSFFGSLLFSCKHGISDCPFSLASLDSFRINALADPHLRENFQIMRAGSRDTEFLAVACPQHVLARGRFSDFQYAGLVHDHRSMDANKPAGFEVSRQHRDGASRPN